MLNIRTLQILVEVARQGGFSRAAQTVHAVQPTVSKAVQAVEDRLGVRIFERANNGVRLTVEGEIVYRRASTSFKNSRRSKPTSPPCTSSKKACSASVFPRSPAVSCSRICSPNTASFTPASTSRFRNRAAPRWNHGAFGGSRSCRHPSPRPAEFFVAPDSGRTAHGHHAPGSSLADRKRLKMDELADNAFIGFEQGFLLNDRIKPSAASVG